MHCQVTSILLKLEQLASLQRSAAAMTQWAAEGDITSLKNEIPAVRQMLKRDLPPLIATVRCLKS